LIPRSSVKLWSAAIILYDYFGSGCLIYVFSVAILICGWLQ